jgi:hypothetical protein
MDRSRARARRAPARLAGVRGLARCRFGLPGTWVGDAGAEEVLAGEYLTGQQLERLQWVRDRTENLALKVGSSGYDGLGFGDPTIGCAADLRRGPTVGCTHRCADDLHVVAAGHPTGGRDRSRYIRSSELMTSRPCVRRSDGSETSAVVEPVATV